MSEGLAGAAVILLVVAVSYRLIARGGPRPDSGDRRGKLSFVDMLDTYFLHVTTPDNLNFFRVLYCALLIHRILGMGAVLPSGTYNPLPLFEMLPFGLLSPEAFRVLRAVLLGSLGCAALGLMTRAALTSSWVCFFLYKGTLLGFTKSAHSNYVWHSDNIIVMVLFILAFAPGIAVYGIDGLRRRRWTWRVPPAACRMADWASPLIMMTLGLAYFGSGYCKVINSPLWADGHTFQAYVLAKSLLADYPVGLWLVQHYWLCVFLSVLTLMIELTFWLAVFFPMTRWFYVPGGLGLHLGILATMGINFFKSFGLTYAIFLRWSDLRRGWCAVTGRPDPDRGRRRADGGSGAKHTAQQCVFSAMDRRFMSARFGRLFVASSILMLIACVVLRVESWPFTDYRVYEYRSHYSRVGAYRVAGYDDQGQRAWLSRKDLRVSPTALDHTVRRAAKAGGAGRLRDVVLPLIEPHAVAPGGRFARVALMRRFVAKDAAGRLHVVDSPVLDL